MANYQELKKKLSESNRNGANKAPGASSYQDIKDSIRGGKVKFDVSRDDLNAFLTDASDYITNNVNEYNKSSNSYSAARSAASLYGESSTDYRNKTKYFQSYLNSQKNDMDAETYEEAAKYLTDTLSAINSLRSGYRDLDNYYSQWDDENTYNLSVEATKEQERKANERAALISNNSEGYKAYGDKWARYVELSQKQKLTKEEKDEAKAAMKDMQSKYRVTDQSDVFNTNMPKDMEKVYIDLTNKSNFGAGITAGFMDAFGVDWLMDKLGRNSDPEKGVQGQFSDIQAAHPGAYAGGNVAGSLAGMLISGDIVGKAIPAIENIPSTVARGAVKSGATFGITGGYRALTNTASKQEWDEHEKEIQAQYAQQGKKYDPVDYNAWKQVGNVAAQAGISAVGGAAGGFASSFVGDLGKAFLVKNGLQTPLAEALRQTLSGTAFAAGNTASTYWLYPKESRPSKEKIAQDLAVAFLFSAVTSTISTMQTTKANKAFVDNAVAKMKQDYQRTLNTNMTPAEQVAAFDDILAYNADIRAAISQNYYAGQQKYIDEILRGMDAIDEQIMIIKNGMAPAATSPYAGSASVPATVGANAPSAYQQPVIPVQPASGPLDPSAYPAVISEALNMPAESEAHQLAASMESGEIEATPETITELETAMSESMPDLHKAAMEAAELQENEIANVEETDDGIPVPDIAAIRKKLSDVGIENGVMVDEEKSNNSPMAKSLNEIEQSSSDTPEPQPAAVATTLRTIKEAGAKNTPYEAVLSSTADIVSSGALSEQQVSDAYAEGLAEYNKKHSANADAQNQGDLVLSSKAKPFYRTLRDGDKIQIVEDTGKSISYHGYTFFISKQKGSGFYDIVESTSGQAISVGEVKSYKAAIELLQKKFDKYGDAKIAELIKASIERHGGTPFYTGMSQYTPTEVLQEAAQADTISLDEQNAIRNYKSGNTSYILNEKLYSGIALNDNDKILANRIDAALDKLPNYKGTTYRVLCFDRQGIEAREAFLDQHKPGMPVFYRSYTSASKTPDAFDIDGELKVRIEIEGRTGKDVSDEFGLRDEMEVLYGRFSGFITQSIGNDSNGDPYIKVKEIVENEGWDETGNISYTGERGSSVRDVQEHDTVYTDVQSISQRDPEGNTTRGNRPQQPVQRGQRDSVRPGESEQAGIGTLREEVAPHNRLASLLSEKLISKGITFNSALLFEQADKAYGGTMASGAYTVKDAYDALELAVNKTLLTIAKNYNKDAHTAALAEKSLQKLLDTLPTQTKRTEEQQSFQQFSTPPNIAYLAAWSANIAGSDVVLEPSAGIGGLAVFPKAWGATVIVNELSERRLGFLKSMGFDRVFNENAEQLNNVLPDDVMPSVVIMNPPFSSTAGRTATNKTENATRHIEQALLRLQDGGRLVAILGRGMSNDSHTFSKWWDELRKKYNIRANISIDGTNYKKYGTTFDVQLVVIDKTGPQAGETITGTYKDLTEIPSALEGIRNDRERIEQHRAIVASEKSSQEKGTIGSGTGKLSHSGDKGVIDAGNVKAPTVHTGTRTALDGVATSKPVVQPAAEVLVSDSESGSGRSVAGIEPGRNVAEPNELVQSGAGVSRAPVKKKAQKNDNGIYAEYVPAELPIKGAIKHPAPLVESAAMSAVSAPVAVYKPNLPADLIKKGALSSAQLENIVYAGQAHTKMLPDGSRKGYFIGDGTGVGKGRQISGIILDNMRQGRKKAIWVSKNLNLLPDAQRDWSDIGQNKDDVASQASFKIGSPIGMKNGIIFTGYDTLRSGKGKETRLQQIVDWVGKDFDGIIAFDEAHNMGNLLGKKGARGATKGSAKAQAGVDLQRMLPNARVVYVSATGATDVNELAYAQRLGLWGRGTAFNDVNDFVSKIGSSGIAAMELVARDMKAMGSYLARSISYDGVTYDTLQHDLTPMQTEIYNTMSHAWQITMQNINEALNITNGNLNAAARTAARSAYYGAMQRFYNQVLTSMSMPSVIQDIKKELADGHSCVLQIVNTNAAEQERQLAKIKDSGGDLDDMDLTPRGTLIGYLENSFPVYAYEEYTDEDGKLRSRIVTDKNGNPVVDRQAVAMRDSLISRINEMSIPDGPLEMLFDAFGVDAVAEVTGRGRRIVPKTDESGRTVRIEERRSKNHTEADIQAFQDGKKRILVFSDAGGTGKSYHADLRAKNQQQRIHYLVQPGWSASTATQGFGRSHRSNQASTPKFKLVTTNIMGQKRFVSTIARRLDQLGALTKGQRETGSGMFTEKDNLESTLSRDSLRLFYERLGKNRIEDIDGLSILEKLGLKDKFSDEYGNFKIMDENVARDMNTFLNRILALEVDEQNTVFNEFYRIFESQYDKALEDGTLDRGMESVRADKIEIIDDKVIRTDETTGATTNYVQAKTYQKARIIATIEQLEELRSDFMGLYKTDSGDVRAVYRVADKTSASGKINKMFRLQPPLLGKYSTWSESTLDERATKLDKKAWLAEWETEITKAPEYDERTVHMLTGTLLPVWDKLPQEGNTRAMRITADDGTQYLGRVIPADQIDSVLRQLGADGRTRETFTAADVKKRVMSGETAKLSQNHQLIVRKRVSGDYRLEIIGKNLWYLPRNYSGIIVEYINYEQRYFIPTGENGESVLAAIIKDNPVTEIYSGGDVDYMKAGDTNNPWAAERVGSTDKKPMPISDIISKIRHDFGIPVEKGRMPRRDVAGQYDRHSHSVQTRIVNDLPTVAHELGHHLDNIFGITKRLSEDLTKELVDNLSDTMKASYPENKLLTEGFAEFIRRYMQNRETAAIDYPLFSKHFESSIDEKNMALINSFADEINAYYSMDADTAQSSIRDFGEGPRDFRTTGEKTSDAADKAYQAWIDSFHGIKLFDRAAGTNTYMNAINSAYADSVAYSVLTRDLTDMNGKHVGDGLQQALIGINLRDANEYKAFGEYLIVRHGPERLEEGMRIFADDRKNSTAWMNARQVALEQQYPEFERAAERLYEFQRNFLQTWGVDTGLVSAESAAQWAERWEFYVPFNRAIAKQSRAGAKRGFANQNSTIRKAHGSGEDFYNPVDNIINNMVKMINAAIRNNVTLSVREAALGNGGLAVFAERVPAPVKRTVYNVSAFKQSIEEQVAASDLNEDDTSKVFGIIDGMDDILVQYERGKATGNVITVLVDGKPEYWKINDPLLLESLTNMSNKDVNAALRVIGTVSRFMTANITGLNLIWSIGSNSVRDLGTLLTFSKDKNLVHVFGGIFRAYMNSLRKPDAQDPMYKEFLAMGGGSESAYTADKT